MGRCAPDTDMEKLRKHVQELLNARTNRRRYRLRVSEEVREEDEWVYFVVSPDRKGVSAYDYADVLSDVEAVLRRDEHVEKVLLVPAVAD